jgi:hypothetical protein
MIENQSRRATNRNAACAAESAFVLPVVLFVLFSTLDLALATIRYNALADASRRIAREAIISRRSRELGACFVRWNCSRRFSYLRIYP